MTKSMRYSAFSGVILAMLSALLAGPGGCTTNPATGEQMLSFMSPSEEKRLGTEEHPKLVKAFGGAIKDDVLSRYITAIGTRLAAHSELPKLKFSFTVLNSSAINAFALPGGYVHVTRGLLALANSEAEVAGVLAHEIGHVTARHAAQRYTKSVFATGGAIAAQIGLDILFGRSQLTQKAVQSVTDIVLKSYSREDELEADRLGVRYLKRAGYDPGAMASFLSDLRAESQLEAKLAGLPPSRIDEFNLHATHPRTIERVRAAEALAAGPGPANPIVGHDRYLEHIAGLIYGDSPDQGYVRGRTFEHPLLRITFEVPKGYRITNSPSQVVARGPDKSAILFESAKKAGSRTPSDYIRNVWARGARLRGLSSFTVNGLAAASATTHIRTQQGMRDARLAAIRVDNRSMVRFLYISLPDTTARLDAGFQATTRSFRHVSAAEAAKWRPLRIKLVRVGPGDTVASLAKDMAFPDERQARFRTLNGLGPLTVLKPGQLVKIVTVDGR